MTYNLYTIKCTELKVFISMSFDNCIYTHVITTPSKSIYITQESCAKGDQLVLDKQMAGHPPCAPVALILYNIGEAGDKSYPRYLEARTAKHNAFSTPLGK